MIDNELNLYDSLEDFYNSPDLDEDIKYNYLARGLRTPQNINEKRWSEEGKSLSLEGFYDMYFE